MIFHSLASSSKGNAYLVTDVETTILIECGISYKQLEKRTGYQMAQIAACFITHEHDDHKLLCSWLNKKFSEDELGELDLFSLLGRGCQVQVTLKEDGKHNDIANVMALPRGMKTPESANPYLSYDIDEDGFAGEKWDALPEWVRGIIERSEQYQQDPPEKPLEMPDDTASEDCPI